MHRRIFIYYVVPCGRTYIRFQRKKIISSEMTLQLQVFSSYFWIADSCDRQEYILYFNTYISFPCVSSPVLVPGAVNVTLHISSYCNVSSPDQLPSFLLLLPGRRTNTRRGILCGPIRDEQELELANWKLPSEEMSKGTNQLTCSF